MDTLFHPIISYPAVAAVFCLAGLLAGSAAGQSPVFKGDGGLQLYSLRAQMATNWAAALDEVQGWGVKYVELAGTYGLPPAQFREELQKRGLVPVSGHFSFEEWATDPEAVLRQAGELGLAYAGCAWIPHQNPFDEATCRKAAEVFNRAGEAAAKHKIRFFYHTHGYEFQPFGEGTLFDLLMRETNPKYVTYEMDIFWIAHPGQDPVKLLAKYPNRFELMHLKDMRPSTPTGLLTGSSDVTNDVALGAGKLDLHAILREAGTIGVKWYFIEDESPVSEQQIPVSLQYLAKLKH